MRNLFRILALNAALVLAALTIPVSAASLGRCQVRCEGLGPTGSYTFSATQGDCCSGNYPNHCPAGSTPITVSWNNLRCAG
jgi:hypothetical protein